MDTWMAKKALSGVDQAQHMAGIIFPDCKAPWERELRSGSAFRIRPGFKSVLCHDQLCDCSYLGYLNSSFILCQKKE